MNKTLSDMIYQSMNGNPADPFDTEVINTEDVKKAVKEVLKLSPYMDYVDMNKESFEKAIKKIFGNALCETSEVEK